MQSEEQLRVSKDRKRDDKQIIDSQERAYWRVYRPPPGYTTVVESSPVPTREHRVKARSKTKEHLSEEVSFLEKGKLIRSYYVVTVLIKIWKGKQLCTSS